MSSRARVRRFTVEQIFGEGSHDVVIDLKLADRVTVVHGKNGAGKTLSLELLFRLVRGELEGLNLCPWARLRLELTDRDLVVERRSADGKGEELHLELLRHGGERRALRLRRGRASVAHARELRIAALPTVEERSRAEDAEEVVAEAAWFAKGHPAGTLRVPAVLDELTAAFPLVKRISTDRLRPARSEEAPHAASDDPAVRVISEQVRDAVAAATAAYRGVSTELDASLPLRLLDVRGPGPAPAELRARAAALEVLEGRLVRLGLLPAATPLLPAEVREDQRAMVALLLGDREKKLAAFQSLADKAELLVTSLNEKLAPKRLTLHVERGYEVSTAAGAPLDLGRLSSGEQHQLVLLHELLFDLEPGTLVLIDEPELSLHLTWQERLLPELLEIARAADLDVVLATHSPYIVGERDDLMVEIGPRGAAAP
jgi:hypothetical protein